MRSPRRAFPADLPSDREFDVVGLGGNASDHLFIIPRFPDPGEKLRFLDYSRQGGGRTATAMVAVARLGFRARYLGGIGDDEEGSFIVQGLKSEGVDTAGIRVRPGGLTQRAFILVHENTGERSIIWGRSAGMPLRPEEVDEGILSSGRLFYTDAQDPRTAARAASVARNRGMPVLADVEDIRPGLDELLPWVDFLIVSAGFPKLATGSSDLAISIRALEERIHGGLVIVTQGPAGAAAGIDGKVQRFPAYEVPVRDTTGAGDVFHAGFAVACLRGMELRDALDFANAVAAMKCRSLGGRTGIPRSIEEVEDFRHTTPHLAPPSSADRV